ncbi:MAG: hypothetical protein Q9181_007395 [Wetmoreana brouardii]
MSRYTICLSPETETWTTYLASLLHSPSSLQPHPPDSSLGILDLCTGTGCISLLLHTLLSTTYPSLSILGIDISSKAIALARRNLAHNIQKGLLSRTAREQVRFEEGDVFGFHGAVWGDNGNGDGEGWWDVVVANPPYISPRGFARDTERSVRNWEPKEALVPPSSAASGEKAIEEGVEGGDTFYPFIQSVAEKVNAKIVAMEVADMQQAERVVRMMGKSRRWARREVWRDENLDLKRQWQEVLKAEDGGEIVIRGEGNGRCVVGWRTR